MTCLTDHIAKQKLLPFLPALICSCFFIAGVSSLLMDSVMGAGGKTWSFAQYQRFWSDPLYFDYLVRSIRVALYATLGTVVIGYAMANWMACGSPALRRSILLLLIFQFFTVTITKVYAILLVLGNNGLINRSLMALGILQKPLPLVNHELGVVIGLTASALPLACTADLQRADGTPCQLGRGSVDIGSRAYGHFLAHYVALEPSRRHCRYHVGVSLLAGRHDHALPDWRRLRRHDCKLCV